MRPALRPLLLILLAGLLMGAGPDAREKRALSAFETAAKGGDAERILARGLDFLQDWSDSEAALDVRRATGEAAFELGRWRSARRQFEAWMGGGGRIGIDDVKHKAAICLAREGNKAAAVPMLKNVASHDPDPVRAASAARELVELHLFDAEWKAALAAQDLLLARDLFQVPEDLDRSRKAVDGLGPETAELLEERFRGEFVGGVLAYLRLEADDQLLDTPETEGSRRHFAVRYHAHPLLDQVPGAADWAAAGEDTNANRVGILVPTTGRFAAPGSLALRGVRQAFAVREALGLPELELIVEDTAGDPEQAERALTRLVEEHQVIAVIGPMIQAEAEALNARADELAIPMLMMVQSPGLAEGHDYAFNTWVTAEEQVDALVEQAVTRLGYQNFAIAYPAKKSGARLADRFWTGVEAAGGRVSAVEGYEPDSTDFRETARRLKGTHYRHAPPGEKDRKLPFLGERTKPQITEPQSELTPGVDFQVVFVPDNYKRVSMLAPGMMFEEINLGGHLPVRDFPPVVLMGGSAMNHPDLIDRGGKYTNGAILADGLFLQSPDPVVQQFAADYRASHGSDPTLLEANAYDSTRFVMQLLAEGITTRRELLPRLTMAAPAESVTGAHGFASSGEMRHQMKVLEVHKGHFTQIWPPVGPPPEAVELKEPIKEPIKTP